MCESVSEEDVVASFVHVVSMMVDGITQDAYVKTADTAESRRSISERLRQMGLITEDSLSSNQKFWIVRLSVRPPDVFFDECFSARIFLMDHGIHL